MKKYKREIVYPPLNTGSFLYDWGQKREPKELKLFETLVAKLMFLRWQHAKLLNQVHVCKSKVRKVLLSLRINFTFVKAIILFWYLSKKYYKTDYLPEELEAFTYVGLRILRIPLIHNIGTRIHACTMAPSYEYLGIKELEDSWIFRGLFSLRWAILQHYYAKRAWNGTIYKKRKIPFYKTHLGKDRIWYRKESQRVIEMTRKRFPEQLDSKWFPIYIDELVYLLEFEGKHKTADVYRRLLQ